MAEQLQVLSVTCNHCGAPLEVPSSTRFVTCQYCNSRLQIHQTGGAAYTEVLAAIDARTQHIAEDVETIKMQNEFDQLDREWLVAREKFRSSNQDGSANPSGVGAAIVATIGVVIGITFLVFFIFGSASAGAPAIFPIFGSGMLLMLIVGAITAVIKSGETRDEQSRYEEKRQRLVDMLRDRRK